MNTSRLRRGSPSCHVPDEIAVGHHVHRLEREPPVLARIGEDALGAQQVLPLLRPAARRSRR